MAKVFIAIPQYRKMTAYEIGRVSRKLKVRGWKPMLDGFHPIVDMSIQSSYNNPHTIRYSTITGDGNLPRARSFNLAVWRKEYDNPDLRCDYYLVMDDDISFSTDAIDILVKDDLPIVGGIYTFKTQDPNVTGKACTRFFDNQQYSTTEPFKVKWLNGGFIMIKAETILTMIDAYPELMFDVPRHTSNIEADKTWALWCPMVYKNERETFFLDEGWAFCQRARQLGFDIWADLRVKLIHWDRENGYSIGV